MVETWLIDRRLLPRVWNVILPEVEVYRSKTPHEIGTAEEIFENLSSEGGDELLVVTTDRRYCGFFTFKVQELLDQEVWGTVAMICMKPEIQNSDVLKEAAEQLEVLLKERGCTVMNYLTKRRGFRKLAPKLGFQPRIIEWMKELS